MKILPSYEELFAISNEAEMENIALRIFHYQAAANPVYRNYLEALKIVSSEINSLKDIPYLPIEFFKTHEVLSGDCKPSVVFTSSGTGKGEVSRHYVCDNLLYERAFLTGFQSFYGKPSEYIILALLPSYLERKGSSLITMVTRLIDLSRHHESGFFLYDHQTLKKTLISSNAKGKKVLLFGVTFALLDFAITCHLEMPDLIIMETGGMKGRGEELVREEVTERLINAFGVKKTHSEYGMTELLSQAYSKGDGIFRCPPWMRVSVRETTDPLSHSMSGNGALNIIDLANLHSCSFIATQDLGSVYQDGTFTVSGRFDHADVRGCNLLIL